MTLHVCSNPPFHKGPPFIPIFCMNSPVHIPWKYWAEFNGNDLLSWLRWLIGYEARTEDWEYWQHQEMMNNHKCHKWNNEKWCYCGT